MHTCRGYIHPDLHAWRDSDWQLARGNQGAAEVHVLTFWQKSPARTLLFTTGVRHRVFGRYKTIPRREKSKRTLQGLIDFPPADLSKFSGVDSAS